ncbi:uncharacterized protein LOC135055003 isoform X2 [Pseudophryne corroboree]
MSASSTHQALDKTEPFRGVQHTKPPLKPKPIVPPRPKEILCSSPNSEIKNALLSPTCGPCSPTSDIPSALKISQLTGPQPYGTRRTSLKRWSSSVGEDANQESNLLPTVESTASDLPTKVVNQPLSSSLKPLPTGSAWKGKSPFMLTTRGWGEQRWNQGKDPHVSESASQKHSSSLTSKQRDLKTRESTSLEETPELESTSNGKFISDLGHRSVAVEAQDLKSSPTENTSHSKDVISPGLGSSGIHKSLEKPAQYNEIKKSHESSSVKVDSPQSDLNIGICKPLSHFDQDISGQSFGSKNVEDVTQITKPNVLIEPKEFKNEQIPNSSQTEVGPTSDRERTLGQKTFPSETIPNEVEYKNTGHHQVANIAPDRPPRMKEKTGQLHPQHINTNYKQHSQNYVTDSVQQSEIKYVEPTTQQEEYLSTKTKDLPKPSVRSAVLKANELASENLRETQQTLDSSLSDSVQPATQETYRHHEHGKIEIRTSTKEEHDDLSAHLQTAQRPETNVQKEADESNHVKCKVKEKPPFSAGTQVTDHVIYRESQHEDNADTAPTDPILTGSVGTYGLLAEKKHERQAADDRSDSEHEEIKAVCRSDRDSLCHTERSYFVDDHQYVDTNTPDDIVEEEHDSLNKREADARMLTVDSMSYKSELDHRQIDSPAESRSVYGKTVLSFHDSEPPSVHLHDPSRKVQSELPEHAITKKIPHLYMGSHVQENDSLLPEDVYNRSSESHAISAKPKHLQHSSTDTEVLHVIHSQTGKPKDNLSEPESYESNRMQERDLPLEKLDYAANESEEQQHRQLEEPLHRQSEETTNRFNQSKEPDHRYTQSKEPYKQYVQLEEPIHRLEQSDESVDQYIQSEGPIHRNEEMERSYEKSEELVHRYEQSEEPIPRYDHSEEPVHHYTQPERLIHSYDQSEPVHHYVQSDESIHRYEQSEEPVHQYVQSGEPVYRYDQSEDPVHQYIQSEEPTHSYVQLEEPIHSYDQSEEPIHHYVQSEEPIRRYDQSEELVHHYVQSDEPVHRYNQSEEPVHHYVQSNEQIQRSEDQESISKQSDATLLKYVQSEQPVRACEQSGEPISKRAHLEEPDHQHEQSEEQNFKYTQSTNIQHSEDSQQIQLYSEEPQHKAIQPKELEQINDMSEEKKLRNTMHTRHENIIMPSAEMNIKPNISVEQHVKPTHSAEAEHTHKYSQQEHSYSEEQTYKDAAMAELDHKDSISEEQNHRQSQSGEPQPRQSYQEGPKPVDDPSEQPRHIDTELDKIKSHTESDKLESEEPQGEVPEGKHAYLDRNINGHIELEESKDSDITSNEHKLQLHTVDGSQAEDAEDTTSQPEEPPDEENFDFLEGTTVLDSSCMRSRASLGKKRCRKTPIPGAATSQEEDPEYWMFRDSTDPKCCPEKDSDDEEKEPTSSDCTPDNSPLPRKSSKKGGIFAGIISPSILKGRLKVRNKTPEDETAKPDSEEAKSPGKEKADSSSHSLNWLHALKKKKKKQPK